jgi:Flp pilus assembly CpaF family ATPase
VLEDTPELRLASANALSLTTTESVTLARLVRTTLRFQPSRIVIGEVRGAEALDLLKAWNTGHPGGIATVHSNGAAAALERLDQLAQEAGVPSQARLVREAIDLVVHLLPRCRISEVLDVKSSQLAPDAGLDPNGG